MSNGGTVRSAWLACTEAHIIARRSHAHCKSGRRGNWLKSSCSMRILRSTHDAMKCGWPMDVPGTFTPRLEDGLFPARRQRPDWRFLVGTPRRHDCTPESCPQWKLCRILPALPARCREPRVHAPVRSGRTSHRGAPGVARKNGVRTRPGTKRHVGRGRKAPETADQLVRTFLLGPYRGIAPTRPTGSMWKDGHRKAPRKEGARARRT